MKTTKFKVLVYQNIFVDQHSLDDGIYETKTPTLLKHDTTMGSLLEEYRQIKEMMITYPTQKQFENLQNCKVMTVELRFLDEQ
jgi:hypothetical protein